MASLITRFLHRIRLAIWVGVLLFESVRLAVGIGLYHISPFTGAVNAIILTITWLTLDYFVKKLLKDVELKLEGSDGMKTNLVYLLLCTCGSTFISSLFVVVFYLFVIPMKHISFISSLMFTLTEFWTLHILTRARGLECNYSRHWRACVLVPAAHFFVFIFGVFFLRASDNYLAVVIHGVFLVFYSPMSIDIWIAARYQTTHGYQDLENEVEMSIIPSVEPREMEEIDLERQDEEENEETWL